MSFSWVLAETTITGMEDHSRTLRRMFIPSISGSPRSRITRSGHWDVIRLYASEPVDAMITS